MSAFDLLRDPRWDATTLGLPLPASPHAVSVSLPRWQDVVGYEEKQPEVMRRLAVGYPRFVVHPLVAELARQLAGDRPCLPLPSQRAAELCAAFISRQTGQPAEIVHRGAAVGVATAEAGAAALKAFWQHTGLIVSSRQAESLLAGRGEVSEAEDARRSLRRQLAAMYDSAEDDVFLTPTGMAAQFAALQAARQRAPGHPTVQLGFPYVDTLKLQEKLGDGATLLHDLDHIPRDLSAVLARGPVAACFAEIPGNPLLGSVDVREVSPLLRSAGVPLIADDVVATPFNVDLGGHADLVATSLTKYVVGTCDAMGGAVICPPRSPLHAELKARLRAAHEELLWGADAAVLDAGARGFAERMARHNANGQYIAGRLRGHPAVERVWYPEWEFREAYEAVRRPGGGFGALVTFLVRDASRCAPAVYDALETCKGPSLGTVFTLACPFTLLAHYTELDWAEACGVSRHLIRLSVGLEDPEDTWQRLQSALAAASPARGANA